MHPFTDLIFHLVLTKVFDGTPTSLVRRLIDDKNLSEEDLKLIRSLINERLR